MLVPHPENNRVPGCWELMTENVKTFPDLCVEQSMRLRSYVMAVAPAKQATTHSLTLPV
jgi:hypothetical protein